MPENRGPQGEQGETGATGATGAPGETGATGARGFRGEDGFAVVSSFISSALIRLENKTDRISERMETLVETTNHRLDDFRTDLDRKIDKNDLLSSVGFKLANIKAVRWGIGVAFTAVVSTVAVQHWWGEILHLLGF